MKTFTFLSSFTKAAVTISTLLFCFFFKPETGFGQATTASWNLTSSNTPAVTGNVNATNMTFGSGLSNTGTLDPNYGSYASNWPTSGTTPVTSTSIKYFQFSITPTGSASLSITSLTLTYHDNEFSFNDGLAIFYSTSSTFATSTQVVASNSQISNTNGSYTNSAISAMAASGQTLYFRVYFYYASSSLIYFGAKSLVLTGTTTSSATIATSAISGSPFCVTASADASVSVPFTSAGTFSSNTYTAQLSGSTGSFGTPTNIGSLVSNANAGTISAAIPANTATGTGYRIRVISSSPSVTGTDNGTNLAINLAANSIVPVSAQNINAGVNGTALTVTEQSTPTSRTWYYGTISGGPYSTSTGVTSTTYTPNFATQGTYYVVCISTFSCGIVTSNAVQVTVSATITTGTLSSTSFCASGGTVSVPFTSVGTFSGNTYTAQLSSSSGSFSSPVNIGSLVSNVNSGTISATVPASAAGSGYLIRVVSSNPAVTGSSSSSTITINALPNIITATATPATICSGSSSQLSGGASSSSAYTYTVISSPSPATGTPVAVASLSGVDDGNASVNLPFSFNFYGTGYSHAYISSNGFISFGASSSGNDGSAIPTTSISSPFIALCYSDLNISQGEIDTFTVGTAPNRKFIIKFNGAGFYYELFGFIPSVSGNLTGQIELNETSNIIDIYLNKVSDGDASQNKSVGVQSSPTSGTAVTGKNGTDWQSSSLVGYRFANVSYSWSPATGLSATNIYNPVATLTNTTSAPVTTTYTLTATATTGCTSSTTVNVAVNPATVITVQPQNTAYCLNNNTPALSVTGTGTGTLTYQWYKNSTGSNSGGTVISGAASATYTPSTATAGTFYYYVVVASSSCSASTVTSVPVTVTVNSLPTVSITRSNSPVCSGNTAIFTLSGTNGAAVSYTVNGNAGIVTLTGGTATISVNNATANQVLTLVSVSNPATNCSQVASGTSTVTINSLPTASISGTTTVCYGSTAVISFSGTANALIMYSVNGGSNQTITLNSSGTATLTTPVITATTTYTLVSVTNGTCPAAVSGSAVISLTSSPMWTGYTSTNWSTASNWCNGTIPDGATNVTIPAGTANLPVLSANVAVNNVTIAPGVTVNLNGYTLTVNGAFSNTGTLTGSSTSGLIINGSAGTVYFTSGTTSNILNTLTVNSGATLTLGNSLNITAGTSFGTVTANGILYTGGNLVLKSDVNGDARVGISSGTINGNVTVERYIPARRAWRFLTVPFSSSTQTIRDAWQEGVNNLDFITVQNPHPGYGTHITGNNNTNLGYDYNTTVNPSLKTWQNTSWSAAEPFTISDKITAYPAYCLFVRGSRAINLLQGASAVPDATTLRATGVLNEVGGAAVTKTYSGAPGDFFFTGNPFASSIDISTAISSARSTGINNNKFWVWDPKAYGSFGVGGYVTYSNGVQAPANSDLLYNSGTTIQSGQAFFVQLSSTSSSASVQFRESDKNTAEMNVFGKQTNAVTRKTSNTFPVIYTNLMLPLADTLTLLDGVAAGFDNRFSAAVDENDAVKLWNIDENISLIRDGHWLAIEMRPVPVLADTLFYRLYLRQQPYALKIFSQNLPAGFPQAYLVDNYLNTKTAVNLHDSTVYNFTPNTDTSSYRNRFMLVFKRTLSATPVSSTFSSVAAEAKNMESGLSVYPNPATAGSKVLLKFSNMKKDVYEVTVNSIDGKTLSKQTIDHQGGSYNYELQLDARWTTGNYIIKTTGSSGYLGSVKLVVGK